MRNNKVIKALMLISQLGISIIVPIIMCTLAGVWLDDRFSLSTTVPLIVTGVLAGIRNAYHLVKGANEDPEDKKDEEKER
jgi:predicted F0F1-ATPase subunit